jgi:SAM-dependent methyltransferase
MVHASLRAFEDPEAHQTIAAMIRRHSTHPEDVREVLLRGLDLTGARDVLDLGCGFGFMAGTVAARAALAARITGVDACAVNAAPFVGSVAAATSADDGRFPTARFHAMQIDSALPWPDASFDLVIGSYSLYFFPDVLPEIARVLRPDGSFLTLTHSERSFVEMLRAAELDVESSPLVTLVRRFSAENAGPRLARHFTEVERIDYPNRLRFGPAEVDEVVTYLCFKLPLLCTPEHPADVRREPATASIQAWMREHGELIVTKDDAGFRCRGPRAAAGDQDGAARGGR